MASFFLILGVLTFITTVGLCAWIGYDLFHDRIDRAIRDAFNDWFRS